MEIEKLKKRFWIGMLILNLGAAFLLFSGAAIFIAVQIGLAFDLVLFPAVLLGYSTFKIFKSGFRFRFLLQIMLGVGIWSLTYYMVFVEPYNLQVREVVIEDARFERPLTIVHLADIQSNGIGEYEESVFEKIQAFNADMIIHTGDLVQLVNSDAREEELHKLAKLFSSLSAELGIYNVEGDTDFLDQLDAIGFDKNAGITTVIDSELGLIETEGRPPIRIVGLNLHSSMGRKEPFYPLRKERDEEVFDIAFGHRPDYVLHLDVSAYDLCLAGHTHGGQVKIPGVGAIVTMSDVPRDWASGFREVEGTQLNVSAGIGAEHASSLPSLRFNCPPEIVVIKIVPKK